MDNTEHPVKRFDLADIDTPAQSEEGCEVELNFNGEAMGWFVTVRGDQSPIVRKWAMTLMNKARLKEWQAARKGKNGLPEQLTEAEMLFGMETAARRVISWRGIILNGEKYPCPVGNPEAVEEGALFFIKKHPLWADQIMEASSDVTNFTKKQSKSSLPLPNTSSN